MKKFILDRISRINKASVLDQIENIFIRVFAAILAVTFIVMASALAVAAALKYANQ